MIIDYTTNGKCSNCGRCCTNILPLSINEIDRIKKYIKKHKISPINRNKGKNIFENFNSAVCPFLNEENKCNIYSCRPEICSYFVCGSNNKKNFSYDGKKIINMLTTFFPQEYCPNPPDLTGINEIYNNKLNKIRGKNLL